MASIACKLSDKVVLTSDNPRDEDPLEIIKEMQKGVGPSEAKKTLVMVDREEATGLTHFRLHLPVAEAAAAAPEAAAA